MEGVASEPGAARHQLSAKAERLVLRNARLRGEAQPRVADVVVAAGMVQAVCEAGTAERAPREADLDGAWLLPGFVNAHDHLDFSTFPALGRPPYANVYEWAADVDGGAGERAAADALAVALPDRLFLGGLRNLLAGATAVVHHNPFHRSLGRADFPVRVLARYGFAHSPGLTPGLRKTYRTTDRRIPWLVHAGEGTDARARGELQALIDANVLRQNTVIAHALAFGRAEAERIAAANACVVWCPESNQRLYGATADIECLRQAGVRIGLGSDSPVSGVRDPLSNLACARATGLAADAALLEMATTGSAEVARLPLGGFVPGAPADFLVSRSLDALLRGDRRGVALVMVAGRARYGEAAWMDALAPAASSVRVEGEPRRLDAGTCARAARVLRAAGARARAAWIAGLRID